MLAAREEPGLSQQVAAEICGIPLVRYASYEMLRFPGKYIPGEIELIAGVLEIKPEDVMSEELVGVKLARSFEQVKDVDADRLLEYSRGTERHILPSPEEVAIRGEDGELVEKILEEFPKKKANIVKFYYGIKMKRPHTLRETGKEFGLTKTRIRQIIKGVEGRAMRLVLIHPNWKEQLESNGFKF